MVILDYTKHSIINNRIVVVIGNGLVGSAIVESISRVYPTDSKNLPLEWSDIHVFEAQLSSYFKIIIESTPNQIDWLWSAGKSGFYSTIDVTKDEFNIFEIFVKLLKSNKQINSSEIISIFHLVSSAGGLFEGQLDITLKNEPLPLRPYGQLKLMQEELVKSNFVNNSYIYRLSTVYGARKNNQRKGLISVLIENTLFCRMTVIDGLLDTKRDYVWVEDVASFIRDQVFDDLKGVVTPYFLVSSKPTTIIEIFNLVKKITNNTVLFRFNSQMSNSSQMIFSRTIMPMNWKPTSLESSIRKIYKQMLSV